MNCHACGKPVRVEGPGQLVDGSYYNPAPDAAAVGPTPMLPYHYDCAPVGYRERRFVFCLPVEYGENRELAEMFVKARAHVMTPKERYEQAISWIRGMSGKLSDPMRSREDVVKALEKMGVVDPEPSSSGD